ncbi:hypothetical protein BJ741DRAFT_617208 [Chytriomyces cf. hyalinus JEL632]|nr:hypothetical protein BJ741DRAFT_617208 [Chytriomyces cf. hyalinus JEL632]
MSGTLAPAEEYSNIKKWLHTLPSVSSMDKLGGSMEDASIGFKGKVAVSQATLDAAATLSRLKGEKSKKWDKWDHERESGILADMDAGSVPKPLTKKPDSSAAAATAAATTAAVASSPPVAINLSPSPPAASPKGLIVKTPASALLKVNLCTDSSSQVHSITHNQFFGSSVAITSALGSASSIDNYRTSHDQESNSLASDGTGGSAPSYAVYSRASTQLQPKGLSKLSHMRKTSDFDGGSSSSNNQLFPSDFAKRKITAKDINSSINSISKETTTSLLVDDVQTRSKSSNSSHNKGGDMSDSDDSANNHTSAFSLAIGRRSQTHSNGYGNGNGNGNGNGSGHRHGKPHNGNTTAKHIHSEALASLGTKLATTSGPNDLNSAGNVARSAGNSESSSLEQLQSNHGGSLPNLNDLGSSRSSNLQGSLPDHPSSVGLQPTPVDLTCSSENMGDESQNAFLRKIRHAKTKTDSNDKREIVDRSPNSSSILVVSTEDNEYRSSRSSVSDSRSFSASSEKKRITAAMLNIGQSDSGTISGNSSVQSLNNPLYRSSHGQLVDSCSNLAARGSNGRASIGLEELKKEFLSGPTNLHANPSGDGSFKGKVVLKSILKSESAPKPSPPPAPPGVTTSHPSLNDGTARVKWGKTRIYVFEQTDEEISLRGGGGSKKDKKRDLMRV